MKEKLRRALSDTGGAIDLASVMVGIIVIGLISAVIAATIFLVIPWAQDNVAKEQLANVHTAEQAYAGLTVPQPGASASLMGAFSVPVASGTPTNAYARLRQLNDNNLFHADLATGSDTTNAASTICADSPTAGSFRIAVKSGSGRVFTQSDTSPSISQADSISGTCFEDVPTGGSSAVPFSSFELDTTYALMGSGSLSEYDGEINWQCYGMGADVSCSAQNTPGSWNDPSIAPVDMQPTIDDVSTRLAQALNYAALSGIVCNSPNPDSVCNDIATSVLRNTDLMQDLPLAALHADYPDETQGGLQFELDSASLPPGPSGSLGKLIWAGGGDFWNGPFDASKPWTLQP